MKRVFSRPIIELPWQGFSLSQTHSCVDYIFNYDVRKDKTGQLRLTGECRNAKGETCVAEKGIRLKRKTITALLALKLEQLPAKRQKETQSVFILDETLQDFTLHLPDGTYESKAMSEGMFLSIAEQLKAYLN